MMCFWKVQIKRWYEEKILKKASKTSGLVTGHLCEALFSLVNATNELANFYFYTPHTAKFTEWYDISQNLPNGANTFGGCHTPYQGLKKSVFFLAAK